LQRDLISAGVEVEFLCIENALWTLTGFLRLRRILKDFRPDLIQGWMYYGSLAASLMARIFGYRGPVFWSIHNASLVKRDNRMHTRAVLKLCANLSKTSVDVVLHCSRRAMIHHSQYGFDHCNTRILPNGFDLQRFHRDLDLKSAFKRSLGLSEADHLVGLVGRLHPHKDHDTFFRAIAILERRHVPCFFLMCGTGVSVDNPKCRHLMNLVTQRHRLRLVGHREDMCAVLNGIDVLCLSSRTEAFPLVLGEAMACGTPCVSTDVGDATVILGDEGIVVPPGNARALADGIILMLKRVETEREATATACRERISRNFELSGYVDRIEKYYLEAHSSENAGTKGIKNSKR
jgi:glycosyltransferase involved in cell wall biosynthesis